MPAIARVCTSQ